MEHINGEVNVFAYCLRHISTNTLNKVPAFVEDMELRGYWTRGEVANDLRLKHRFKMRPIRYRIVQGRNNFVNISTAWKRRG